MRKPRYTLSDVARLLTYTPLNKMNFCIIYELLQCKPMLPYIFL